MVHCRKSKMKREAMELKRRMVWCCGATRQADKMRPSLPKRHVQGGGSQLVGYISMSAITSGAAATG